MVANINGTKSRCIVSDAITMLENMEHNGGQGPEPTSGDGTRILVQVPHAFLKDTVTPLGFDLPIAGAYGVGATFFPKDQALQKKCTVELDNRGNIAPTGFQTNRDGLFAAGDARRGQSLVV